MFAGKDPRDDGAELRKGPSAGTWSWFSKNNSGGKSIHLELSSSVCASMALVGSDRSELSPARRPSLKGRLGLIRKDSTGSRSNFNKKILHHAHHPTRSLVPSCLHG